MNTKRDFALIKNEIYAVEKEESRLSFSFKFLVFAAACFTWITVIVLLSGPNLS